MSQVSRKQSNEWGRVGTYKCGGQVQSLPQPRDLGKNRSGQIGDGAHKILPKNKQTSKFVRAFPECFF